ncbi:hypothetical protein [uncultured Lacinutrix sp.]|uniref:hypothetical protein n=1 Tax=uncultured Lacinutrix sp. TaxID=574032 RepID=UPI00261CD763|nr:hypothetical protein [uncultured Lacinutrix sp.]
MQYILNVENQNYDIVFLGSSRVANHVDTKLFDSLSSKKTINLGVLGASLNDNFLELKLLITSNKIKNLVFQVDSNFEMTNSTTMVSAQAVPFIRNNIVKKHIKENLSNFNKMYYLPFYRYAINGHKMGIRESFFSLVNKKPRVNPEIGYNPKYGNYPKQTASLPSEISKSNPVLDNIVNLCKKHNINLILFVAPYSSKMKNIEYIDKLNQKLPNLLDMSRGYEDKLFYNYGHLNHNGAQVFTKDLYVKIKDKLIQ